MILQGKARKLLTCGSGDTLLNPYAGEAGTKEGVGGRLLRNRLGIAGFGPVMTAVRTFASWYETRAGMRICRLFAWRSGAREEFEVEDCPQGRRRGRRAIARP